MPFAALLADFCLISFTVYYIYHQSAASRWFSFLTVGQLWLILYEFVYIKASLKLKFRTVHKASQNTIAQASSILTDCSSVAAFPNIETYVKSKIK